jgi:hypothetical protein
VPAPHRRARIFVHFGAGNGGHCEIVFALSLGAYTFMQTVSQDGKTLIIETTRTDSSGKERKNVLVYEKMK